MGLHRQETQKQKCDQDILTQARRAVRSPPTRLAVTLSILLAGFFANLVSTPGDPLMPVIGAAWSVCLLGICVLVACWLIIDYQMRLLHVLAGLLRHAPSSGIHISTGWRWIVLPVLLLLAIATSPARLMHLRFNASQRAMETAAKELLATNGSADGVWVGLYYAYHIRVSLERDAVQFQVGASDDDGDTIPRGFTFDPFRVKGDELAKGWSILPEELFTSLQEGG